MSDESKRLQLKLLAAVQFMLAGFFVISSCLECVGPFAMGLGLSGLALHATSVFKIYAFARQERDGASGLITTGPYRWIGHPMYTGLMLFCTAAAITSLTMLKLPLLVVLLIVLDRKSRLEEQELLQQFGDDYRSYRQRTWRFIPGIY